MQRLFAYATTAILTFLLGVVVFQAALTIDSLEGRFRNWLDTPPTLEASAEVRLTAEQADANQVYCAVIQEKFATKGVKFLFINAQTTGYDIFENDESAVTCYATEAPPAGRFKNPEDCGFLRHRSRGLVAGTKPSHLY